MSELTSGSSVYWRIPFSGPSAAAALNASLTCSTVTSVFEHAHEVGDRTRRHRHPQRGAVQLALHRLQHQARGAGRAGRGRHDVDGRGTGPAGVLVRAVDEALIAGVGVDGVHQTLLDAEGVVEDLDQRNEAVRGARGVGDHDVLVGVEGVVVDADHEGGVCAGGGGRDDDPRRAAVEVGRGLVAVGEDAGGLDHHVDAEVAPGDLLGVSVRHDLEHVAVDVDSAVDDR